MTLVARRVARCACMTAAVPYPCLPRLHPPPLSLPPSPPHLLPLHAADAQARRLAVGRAGRAVLRGLELLQVVQGTGQAQAGAVEEAPPGLKGKQLLGGGDEVVAPERQGAAADGQHVLQLLAQLGGELGGDESIAADVARGCRARRAHAALPAFHQRPEVRGQAVNGLQRAQQGQQTQGIGRCHQVPRQLPRDQELAQGGGRHINKCVG